jgi:hypothetical protein
MRTRKVPIKSSRFCALCKHWYDPANSHLRPVVPMIGQWEIDRGVKCPCMARNGIMTDSESICPKFEKKIG